MGGDTARYLYLTLQQDLRKVFASNFYMESHLLKIQITESDFDIIMVHKMHRDTIFDSSYIQSVHDMVDITEMDPVFLYSGMHTLAATDAFELKAIGDADNCGTDTPAVAYWASFVNDQINTVAELITNSLKF